MRQIIAVVLLLISFMGYSQGQNPFSRNENDTQEESSTERYTAPINSNQLQAEPSPDDCDGDGIPNDAEEEGESGCRDPNPADPIPIDHYIPFLLIAAMGIIIYQTRQQKQFN